jgi:hypothetical protein
MSLGRKLLSILLLLAILPATLHCTLENAGVLGDESCCSTTSSHQEDTQDCADLCDTLESKGFRFVKDNALVFPPIAFSKLIPVEPVHGIRQAASIRLERSDPAEFQRYWQFLQRAAPLARAPSNIS